MKKHNLLYVILLGITFSNCGGKKKGENSIFTFDSGQFAAHYLPEEHLDLGVLNPNTKEIDSIVYYVNDTKVGTIKGNSKLPFELKNQKLGYLNLKALVYYEGENAEATARVELVSSVTPKLLKYKIINTYPHDTDAFT